MVHGIVTKNCRILYPMLTSGYNLRNPSGLITKA